MPKKTRSLPFSPVLNVNYHNSVLDINGSWEYSFIENLNYFYIKDLAFTLPALEKGWSITFGFKDQMWSMADRYWDYGLWQASYRIDPFRPVQMGIPGLHVNYNGNTSLIFLASYFYIPDINIRLQLKEKTITSENPFFLNENEDEWAKLKLEEWSPFRIKRFLKPTLAIQLKQSISHLKNSSISLSYAYKPSNRLQYAIFLPTTGGINLSSPLKQKAGFTDFDYALVTHHLASLEGELVLARTPSEKFSVFASVFYEYPLPLKKPFGQRWFTDSHEPHFTFSLFSYFEEKIEEHLKILFTVGYSKVIEDRPDFNDDFRESWEPVFAKDLDWKHALSTSVEYQNSDRGFLSRLRMSYTLDNGFYVLALDNEFSLTSHFKIYLSGDVLFKFSENPVEKGTSNIYKYKDLSRLLIGGKGVF